MGGSYHCFKETRWNKVYWISHSFCKHGYKNSVFINWGIFGFCSAPWSCL
jgi:hypothetical protein